MSAQEIPGKHFIYGHHPDDAMRIAKLYVNHLVAVKWSLGLMRRGIDPASAGKMHTTVGQARFIGVSQGMRVILVRRTKSALPPIAIPLDCIYSIQLIIPGYTKREDLR